MEGVPIQKYWVEPPQWSGFNVSPCNSVFKLLCAHIRLTLSHLGTTLAFGEVLEDDEKTDEGHC